MANIKSAQLHHMDDLFYLGSTSKPLFATCIMSLVAEGKITLDSPTSTWIQEFSNPRLKNGSYARSPVIAEMLSHTSGIFGNANASRLQQRLVWNFTRSLAEAATQIARQPFIYPPGEGFSYGGASMTITGRIAELISKMEFDAFAEQAVFRKLGMKDTFYRTEIASEDRFSVLYTNSSGKLYKTRFQPHPRPGSFVLPPGGIISTARDLSKFMRLHLSTGETYATDVLSNSLISRMRIDNINGHPMDFKSKSRQQSTASIANNKGYGLGWMLDEIRPDGSARIFFHGGAFGTLIWGDTETNLGIILLTHVPLAQVAKLWDEIIDIIRRTWGSTGS